jgi:beta-galactosidase GanA
MHHNHAAIIENKVGKGKVVFLGTDPGYEIMQKLIRKYAMEKNVPVLAAGDKNIIVVPRTVKNEHYRIIINIENTTKRLVLKNEMVDLITGEKFSACEIKLKPFQVIFGKL